MEEDRDIQRIKILGFMWAIVGLTFVISLIIIFFQWLNQVSSYDILGGFIGLFFVPFIILFFIILVILSVNFTIGKLKFRKVFIILIGVILFFSAVYFIQNLGGLFVELNWDNAHPGKCNDSLALSYSPTWAKYCTFNQSDIYSYTASILITLLLTILSLITLIYFKFNKRVEELFNNYKSD